MARPSVFFSYGNGDERDRGTAHRLAGGLRSLGAEVWIAPDSIPAGDEWRPVLIQQVLERSTHFVVLLSASSVTSAWVRREIDLAARRHADDPEFRVLPLLTGRFGDYPGREFLNRFQRIPFHDTPAAQLAELARAVGLDALTAADTAELIAEKTVSFVGRDNVFEAIDDFLASGDRGYLTIEGDPGAGKTTLLAEYVRRTGYVAHFNIRGQSLNTSRYFVHRLGSNLAARYGIAGVAAGTDADRHGEILGRLLSEARANEAADRPLVVVVDALDEVNTGGDPEGANVLLLPRHLPGGVYFILSSRRAGVPLHTDAPNRVFDLGRHHGQTMADVREYLRRQGSRDRLRGWLADHGIPLPDFVDVLAGKSDGNFMYLRHVLPELAAGVYQDLDIRHLPQGLEQYYDDHWRAMGRDGNLPTRLKVWVIYLLCEFARPVSTGVLARILREVEPGADAMSVQQVLDEWRQFLHRDEEPRGARFSLYHASFRDFLHRKDTIRSAGLVLRDVNAVIADVLWKHEYGRK
ncbi:TIR domain-containing protein [Actinoplanes subglobosus]|uniref:TIR domain-containing protein n=1 Tax=Actinoplanes subglobosus TaxID=1547892 RepID=A0ABV8J7J2_9ACTN